MSKNLNLNNILKENKNHEGLNLYEHLINILSSEELINNKKLNLYDNFEKISNFIKENNFKYNIKPNLTKKDNKNSNDEKISNLMINTNKILYNNDKMKKEVNDNYEIPNIIRINKNLNLIGKGLIKEETILLNKSISKFIFENKNLTNIKFFGKIFGLKKDYYVIYAENKFNIKENIDEKYENSGEGINFYSFFVTNSILENWKELPLISPNQLLDSKNIPFYFTGDLEKNVNSYLSFDGQEKHLLKAKLVRILYSCEIILKDFYRLNDKEEVEKNDEFSFPSKNEIMDLENWSHLQKLILKSGRVSYFIPSHLDEDEKNNLIQDLEEKEKIPERFSQISNDVNFENIWKIKYYGDTDNIEKNEEVFNYGVIELKNLNWPGYLTLVNLIDKTIDFIYLGYGVKKDQQYLPNKLQIIYNEPEDINEQPEPNFKEEPKVEEEGEEGDENEENEDDNEEN